MSNQNEAGCDRLVKETRQCSEDGIPYVFDVYHSSWCNHVRQLGDGRCNCDCVMSNMRLAPEVEIEN